MTEITPYRRKAQYYETDQMGIIHHSNYIRWFEETRVDYLDKCEISYQRIEEIGIIIPVLEVLATYKEMVRFNDQVLIYTKVDEYTGTRLTLSYEIRNQTNELLTTGYSKHCFLSAETGRLISLKKSFPEVHQKFLNM
ncbi:acyl-CoA thioester hydrolase [Enterococcus sp. PF1-24]|uniref:acyl-CoA thioesterase n=1 Tax=unclassified Enterococcus TaxID=2608891 RepID=UPI00247633B5|nr:MULTISPECIES: thioesterase family protein [unclassified Enterococcus]MDH6364192.1 acyl-CoA thioester hydrolase [Enterococcus sp. PFB1-1]MDH6401293.1 acyl-CoA thioester hydrolase [Enterococcus sp. PF1-24]